MRAFKSFFPTYMACEETHLSAWPGTHFSCKAVTVSAHWVFQESSQTCCLKEQLTCRPSSVLPPDVRSVSRWWPAVAGEGVGQRRKYGILESDNHWRLRSRCRIVSMGIADGHASPRPSYPLLWRFKTRHGTSACLPPSIRLEVGHLSKLSTSTTNDAGRVKKPTRQAQEV